GAKAQPEFSESWDPSRGILSDPPTGANHCVVTGCDRPAPDRTCRDSETVLSSPVGRRSIASSCKLRATKEDRARRGEPPGPARCFMRPDRMSWKGWLEGRVQAACNRCGGR